MNDLTFQQLADLIHKSSGIFLTPEKKSLLTGRIRSRMNELNLKSFEQYASVIRKDESGQELIHLINAIATHYTFFFRERRGLDAVVDEVDRRIKNGQLKIRIWCAACSSGEEPYSLAMLLHHRYQERMTCLDIKILATDISTRILQVAQQAHYNEARVLPVEAHLKDKYLRKLPGQNNGYAITDPIKRMVQFRRLNLAVPRLPFNGPIDAILCRNVMIYFDSSTIKMLINEFERVLAVDGLCVVGATETIREIGSALKFDEAAVFRKRPQHAYQPSVKF